MGYRLEISKIEYTGVSGYKLYGYINEEELKKLKSFRWLVEKDFIDEDDTYWGYNYNPQIILNSNEFIEFVQLYNDDLNKYYKELGYDSGYIKDSFINNTDMKELLKSNNKKLLEWW